MNKHVVLVCDDNRAIHDSLADYLTPEGIEMVSVYDGAGALYQIKHNSFDVVILDVMLPGIDGYEVCRQIRRISNVYIIMMSAKGEDVDRIVGLEVGADDYLSKPVSPREVVIRIKKAIMKSVPAEEPAKLTLAELTVYPESYKAFVNDQEVSLTPKESEILIFMLANVNKVLSRERIINAAWGYEYYGDTRAVDTIVKRLRQKLTFEGVHFAIRSVYGVGYIMEETNADPK